MEAKFVALSVALRDVLGLRNLLAEMTKQLKVTRTLKTIARSKIFEDNNGALTLANDDSL